MVFHWSLSDSKSPQVSKTLLSILAVLNNAVVWMVSIRPLTPKSSTSFQQSFSYCTDYNHYYYFIPCEFFLLNVCWGFSNQLSMTQSLLVFLGTLVVPNNAVISRVSILKVISISSRLFPVVPRNCSAVINVRGGFFDEKKKS